MNKLLIILTITLTALPVFADKPAWEVKYEKEEAIRFLVDECLRAIDAAKRLDNDPLRWSWVRLFQDHLYVNSNVFAGFPGAEKIGGAVLHLTGADGAEVKRDHAALSDLWYAWKHVHEDASWVNLDERLVPNLMQYKSEKVQEFEQIRGE